MYPRAFSARASGGNSNGTFETICAAPPNPTTVAATSRTAAARPRGTRPSTSNVFTNYPAISQSPENAFIFEILWDFDINKWTVAINGIVWSVGNNIPISPITSEIDGVAALGMIFVGGVVDYEYVELKGKLR